MTNKILFGLISERLTEDQLGGLMRESDVFRFQINGSWFRWDGTAFRGFDGASFDASISSVKVIKIVDPSLPPWEIWDVPESTWNQSGFDQSKSDPIKLENRTLVAKSVVSKDTVSKDTVSKGIKS